MEESKWISVEDREKTLLINFAEWLYDYADKEITDSIVDRYLNSKKTTTRTT